MFVGVAFVAMLVVVTLVVAAVVRVNLPPSLPPSHIHLSPPPLPFLWRSSSFEIQVWLILIHLIPSNRGVRAFMHWFPAESSSALIRDVS